MRTIIYLILTFLLLNSVASAQHYYTSYTVVRDEFKEELVEEKTLFVYSDNEIDILNSKFISHFRVIKMTSRRSFILEDNQENTATIEYLRYPRKHSLRKTGKYKCVKLVYDNKEYLFYFEKP